MESKVLDVIIIWVIFQLIVIGLVGATDEHDVIEKTYDCSLGHYPKFEYQIGGIIFPLVMFVPRDSLIEDYCKIQPSSPKISR